MRLITNNICPACLGADLEEKPSRLQPFIVHRLTGRKATKEVKAITLICRACKTAFLNYRYADVQMARLYYHYRDAEYVRQRGLYEPYYPNLHQHINKRVEYMDVIEAFLSPLLHFPVDILDYGGDTGINTPFEGRRGKWDVYDIDAIPVMAGAYKVERPGGPYDLIVCANVLEHVSYPDMILAEILPLMGKDTILYVEVPMEPPNPDGWHEHINLFSTAGMAAMLERCGFTLIAKRIEAVPFLNQPQGFLQMMFAAKRKDTQ